ncbi:hypothetical protein EDC01DRAFT_633262 [Geopyxis carbonaria]|nr:hypothetical protein EDC01DRAFT_633262 [Geopyxis carbonaria]
MAPIVVLLPLLLALASLSTLSAAALTAPEICQRYAQASTRIGSKLYYDGGWWAPKDGGDPVRATSLLSLDISKSWKISAPLLREERGVDVPVEHLSDNNVMFADAGGALQQFSFSTGKPEEEYRRWTVDPGRGGEWEAKTAGLEGFTVSAEDGFVLPISNAGYAQGSAGFGYSVGGDAGLQHSSSSVVEYALQAGTVTNMTAAPVEISKGALVFLPLAATKKGVLISLGGKAAGDLLIRPKMVFVFDIDSKKWYSQEATGDAPASLISATAVAVSAQDDSSHTIYLSNANGISALSVPSFTWYNVQPLESNAPIYRESPSLNIAGNRQMIMYGGQNGGNTGRECDINPVSVFDMTDLIWTASFIADADAYEVPDLITRTIGGNGKGGAKMKAPMNGWADKQLGSLFKSTGKKKTAKVASNTATKTDAAGNPVVYITTIPETRNIAVTREKVVLPEWALITVATIGGVLAALLFALLFFWCQRKRTWASRRRKSDQRQLLDEDDEPVSELHSDGALYELSPGPAPLHVPLRMKTVKVTEDTCEVMGDTSWKRRSKLSILSSNEVSQNWKPRKGSFPSSQVTPPIPAYDINSYSHL